MSRRCPVPERVTKRLALMIDETLGFLISPWGLVLPLIELTERDRPGWGRHGAATR